MRSRNWFITINEGAECWYKFRDVITDLQRCKCTWIEHNDTDNLHVHILLRYDNARTFESMLNAFEGAHIEVCKYYNKSMRYLLHLDDKDKKQYDIECLHSNYTNDELITLLNVDEFEFLSTESVLEYIQSGQVTNLTEAVKIWGINQVSVKRGIIESLIKENERLSMLESNVRALEFLVHNLKEELYIYKTMFGDLEKGVSIKDE